MAEIWKRIEWADGNYYVSNLGNVKSEDFVVLCKDGRTFPRKGQMLQGRDNGRGYLKVDLRRNGVKRAYYIHRLVAEAFIPNPDNLPFVNHKDFNPGNNSVDNLEWTTPLGNVKYSEAAGHYIRTDEWVERLTRSARAQAKPVIREGADGEKVYYYSMSSARFDGFNPSEIHDCCNSATRKHKGYRWRYATPKEIAELEGVK